MAPVRSLIIGGREFSEFVDWSSLDRLEGIHGHASLSVEVPLADQWEMLPAELAADASVVYRRDGVVGFEGTVARLPRTGPNDPTLTIEARGYWAELSDREDFVKGFVETRWELFKELPEQCSATSTNKVAENLFTTDLTDQLLISMPEGTDYKNSQRSQKYLWILDGHDQSAQIELAQLHINFEQAGAHEFSYGFSKDLWNIDISNDAQRTLTTDTYGAYEDDVLTDVGTGRRLLWVRLRCTASATTTAERFGQVRNMALFIDRTTRPTVPEAVYEGANGLGVADSLTQSGTWAELRWLMWDTPDTPENHITSTLAKHSTPVLCGIFEGREMRIKPRPSAPDGTTRHFVVSKALQPGMVWGVARDDEIAKDYVACDFGLEPVNEVGQDTPASTTWPDDWSRSSSTNNTVYESGSDRYFRIKSDGTEANPEAQYRPDGGSGDGIAVTPGDNLQARCRAYLGAYNDGTANVRIAFYDSGGSYLSHNSLCSFTAASPTEKWYSNRFTVPATAAYARASLRWYSSTGAATCSLYVRNIELRKVTPAETAMRTYYPSDPGVAANEKVGLITLEQATEEVAAEAAQLAYDLWSEPYEGPVSGLVGEIRTIDGQRVPVEEMRVWDWIEDLDAPEGERGPHLITQVHETGEEVDLQCGGDVAFHFEREKVLKRGRYFGVRTVRKRVRKARYRITWRNGHRVRKLISKAKFKRVRRNAYYQGEKQWMV